MLATLDALTSPQKARSRLKSVEKKSKFFDFSAFDFKTQSVTAWLEHRKNKLGSLVIGIIGLIWLCYLLTQFYPLELRDWLWPGSYLSVLSVLILSSVYIWSFITTRSSLAWGISLASGWLLWQKLHGFELTKIAVFMAFLLILLGATAPTRQKLPK